MKRPLAVIGLCALTAQCAALFTDSVLALLFSAILLAAGAGALVLPALRRRPAAAAALLSAGLAMGLTAGAERIWAEPVRALAGQTAQFSGVVLERSVADRRCTLTVRGDLRDASGSLLRANVRLVLSSSTAPSVQLYDTVTIRDVALSAPGRGWELSARGSYMSRRVYLTGAFSAYSLTAQNAPQPPWYAWIAALRARLVFALRAQLPHEPAALAAAMLLNDRSALSGSITDAFRRCGMSAVLVVSGMHLSFLTGALFALLGRLHVPRRVSAAICMPAVFLFVALTGFSGSAMRAGIMLFIGLLGLVIVRTPDSLNSLGASALALMLLRPFAGGDVGVQLSFLATGGLVYVGPKLRRFLRSRLLRDKLRTHFAGALCAAWAGTLIDAFAMSVAATVFTAPLIALQFDELSLVGPFANVLLMLPVQLLIVSAALCAGLGALGWASLARPAAWIAGTMAQLLRRSVFALARLPVLENRRGVLVFAVAFLLLAAGTVKMLGLRRRTCAIVLACSMLLSAVPVVFGVPSRTSTVVTVMRCGSGLAIEAAHDGHSVLMLADGGRSMESEVPAYFNGRAGADVVLLPNESYDPSACWTAAELVRTGSVRQVFCASDFLPDEWRPLQDRCTFFMDYDAGVFISEDFRVEKLDTDSGGWYLIHAGSDRILIPLSAADALDLPPGTHADLLVMASAARHLSCVSARAAVLSASAYGETALALEAADASLQLYSTARSGTMQIEIRPDHTMTVTRK